MLLGADVAVTRRRFLSGSGQLAGATALASCGLDFRDAAAATSSSLTRDQLNALDALLATLTLADLSPITKANYAAVREQFTQCVRSLSESGRIEAVAMIDSLDYGGDSFVARSLSSRTDRLRQAALGRYGGPTEACDAAIHTGALIGWLNSLATGGAISMVDGCVPIGQAC